MDFVLFNLIDRGGWVMYPILACSLVGLAFFIERLYVLRKSRVAPRSFLKSIGQLIDQKHYQEARFLCQEALTPVARLAQAALKVSGKPRSLIKEVLEESGRREANELYANLNILGVVASVSPLLGLLGTVTGMIRAFDTIALEGVGNPASMAGGISEALLTTAAGLCVAIPVLVAHRFLLNRAETLISELEDFSLYLMESLSKGQPLNLEEKNSPDNNILPETTEEIETPTGNKVSET